LLDRNGGTEVFQVAPSQITLTDGQEHLRAVRLSPRGLMRWYAGCCSTPVANTLGPKWAFAGILHTFIDHDADGRAADDVLGPVLARIHGRFGKGELAANVSQRAPLGLILRSIGFLLKGWLAGRATPSPFFGASGNPTAEPIVLTPAEREELRQRCGP